MPSILSTQPIEVIYEKGILRPVSPLNLEEGTRLEVTMLRVAASTTATERAQSGQDGQREQVDDAEYAAFLHQLDNVAALPLQSSPQPYVARDHDAILYPKQGSMP